MALLNLRIHTDCGAASERFMELEDARTNARYVMQQVEYAAAELLPQLVVRTAESFAIVVGEELCIQYLDTAGMRRQLREETVAEALGCLQDSDMPSLSIFLSWPEASPEVESAPAAGEADRPRSQAPAAEPPVAITHTFRRKKTFEPPARPPAETPAEGAADAQPGHALPQLVVQLGQGPPDVYTVDWAFAVGSPGAVYSQIQARAGARVQAEAFAILYEDEEGSQCTLTAVTAFDAINQAKPKDSDDVKHRYLTVFTVPCSASRPGSVVVAAAPPLPAVALPAPAAATVVAVAAAPLPSEPAAESSLDSRQAAEHMKHEVSMLQRQLDDAKWRLAEAVEERIEAALLELRLEAAEESERRARAEMKQASDQVEAMSAQLLEAEGQLAQRLGALEEAVDDAQDLRRQLDAEHEENRCHSAEVVGLRALLEDEASRRHAAQQASEALQAQLGAALSHNAELTEKICEARCQVEQETMKREDLQKSSETLLHELEKCRLEQQDTHGILFQELEHCRLELAALKSAKAFDPQLSARVLISQPDAAGIELDSVDDALARADITAESEPLLERVGAVQAFRIGRVKVNVGQEPVPVVYTVTVLNDGQRAWPETTMLVHEGGRSLGLPLFELGVVDPNCAANIFFELSIPKATAPARDTATWILSDVATGKPLGPVFVFETEWIQGDPFDA